MARLRSNEWNFAANMATLITELLGEEEFQDSPLGHAEPELSELNGAKRLDLVIFARAQPTNPLVTGELKPPYVAEGRNPHSAELRDSAHRKASRAGALYFLTWNIRRVVGWKTDDPGVALDDRVVYDHEMVNEPIKSADDVRRSTIQESLLDGVKRLLHFFSALISGQAPVTYLPLDRVFIARLEAALYYPVDETIDALTDLVASDAKFKTSIERWMRDDQQWLVSAKNLDQNLERAARFTCYVLVNRLCFYNALRRKFAKLPRLRVPDSITTGAALKRRLIESFEQAKRYTGDYETVFDQDFGDTLPFRADSAVAEWRKLIRSLDHYDFAGINVEVIGAMYQQLIRPEERYRYGQHYTQPAVVDLINSFAIQQPNATVLDPGCGGGTFLVRSYIRKKTLDPKLDHTELLETICGCDVLQYACHLSTINIAIRDLIDDDNFPRIHHGDFLALMPGSTFQRQPVRMQAGGLPTGERVIPIDEHSFDAVVGNPPYIQAKQIPRADRERYRDLAQREWPGIEWSIDSDIYPHFWTHGATFLRSGGILALLTQAAWLDGEYGIPVQQWMLENFKILPVLETSAEPWFTDARVATVVTILQQEDSAEARDSNPIRFVQFWSRLSELLDGPDDAHRLVSADRLRDEIMAIGADADNDRYRIRLVTQSDLRAEGTDATEYVGSKWGRYLRSIPTLYELQKVNRASFQPLVDFARVARGATTNCDSFFIVDDVSRRSLRAHPTTNGFKQQYGVARDQVASRQVAIIERDDGVVLPIEKSRLRKILKTARDVDWLATRRIQPSDYAYAVYIDEDRPKLTPLAKRYVEAGEREHWHESASFANVDKWYSLRDRDVAPIFFIKTMQYTPLVMWNDGKLVANQRLYKIVPNDGVDAISLCALLNSTLMAAERYAAAKALGREAAIDAEVFTVRALRTPDIANLSDEDRTTLREAILTMAERQVGPMHEEALRDTTLKRGREYAAQNPVGAAVWPAELNSSDRQQIDEIVLKLIGVPANDVTKVRVQLYDDLVEHTRRLKLLELEAQINRRGVAAASEPSIRELAAEAWTGAEAAGATLRKVPKDFLTARGDLTTVHLPFSRRVTLHAPGLFDKRKVYSCQIAGATLEFATIEEAEYVASLARHGASGEVQVPKNSAECGRITAEIASYLDSITADLGKAAAEITGTAELQQKIVREALKRVLRAE